MVFASFNAYPASSSASVSISVIDCNTVGNLLDTDKLYSNLRIYPNPVDEILNLDVQILNSAHEIEIFDMFGKVILHEKLKIKNVPLQINVSTLSGGIYYIKTGQEIRKFIKE
jgi:hypothetical protein